VKIFCDIGNTFSAVVIMDKRIKVKKIFSENLINFLTAECKNKKCKIYVSCVVEEIEKKIKERFKNSLKNLTYRDLEKYVKIKYNKSLIGIDRILNIFAAKKFFNCNTVVVSLGTAIVLDYIDHNCVHLGGEIFPGLKLLTESLYSGTSKLPLVKIKKGYFTKFGKKNLIGNNTKDCIIKGIINFCVSGIENFINIIKPKNVVITGGDAKIFDKILVFKNFGFKKIIVENLVVIGIILWCYYEGLLSLEEFKKLNRKLGFQKFL